MSSEKRKIAYIDGKPYEIGSKHTSILKFVKSYLGEKKKYQLYAMTLTLPLMELVESVQLKLLWKKMDQQKL